MPTPVTNQGPSVDQQAASEDPVSLGVVTQNMKGLPFAKDLGKRTKTFIGEINDEFVLGPDLVAVQEAFVPGIRGKLKHSPGHPYYAMPKVKGCKIMNGGIAALSRYPIIYQKFEPFDTAKASDSLVSKGVLLTRIKHPILGEVDFYTSHLQASYDGFREHDDIRLAQAREIGTMIAAESGERTVILAGDLNMVDLSSAYDYLTVDETGPRLVDTMRTMHPDADLDTWREDNPYIKGEWGSERIDYVLIRPGKGWDWDEEASYGALTYPCDEENPNEVCLDSPDISDHAGILENLVFTRTD